MAVRRPLREERYLCVNPAHYPPWNPRQPSHTKHGTDKARSHSQSMSVAGYVAVLCLREMHYHSVARKCVAAVLEMKRSKQATGAVQHVA